MVDLQAGSGGEVSDTAGLSQRAKYSAKSDANESSKTESLGSRNESNSDVHLPLTQIHLKSHEWFGEFITKHEIPRKTLHSSIGFVTLYLYTTGADYRKVKWPLIFAFVNIFVLDLVRLRCPAVNKLYCRCVGALMRKREIHAYNGVLWYLLGLIFAFSFFPKDVALISLFLLSWSDTAASTFGRKYGHLTPKIARNKSLAGSIAAFIVGVSVCYLFYGVFVPRYAHISSPGELSWSAETSKLSLSQFSLLSGVLAAFSEGIDLFNWDDNFTIPALSAIFMNTAIRLTRRSN
ncbi:LANO_0G17458g1_1 [Lachancea nothofagi CBS 11611]|uniref:LANO_0G17458g1_1 n=1 Tax=Lachancea nothofagi CBS 11611 TaxID=1266666 RepID=A0A1G4KKV5_9SACH|nr:LANO_0G17458g1_1 [Lachancea nothofagi CBS 11611]